MMISRAGSLRLLLALLVVPLALSACGDDDTNDAHVQVLITDAPSDYIARATVTISEVYLVPADGDTASDRVHLLDSGDPPVVLDLMALRDSVQAFLADGDVPPRDYSQLRLVVEEAEVALVPGTTFSDGDSVRALTVPSGAQTGIKVQLSGAIQLDEDDNLVLVVDFDVDQSFVLQGNPETPAGLMGVIFTPVIHEIDRSMSPSPGSGPPLR